ncbi:MAG: methyltransferase domain-containing protein [Desulfobacca sp.]|nr:methyltransferase domain-containing protein [Desulfobacca sp.]
MSQSGPDSRKHFDAIHDDYIFFAEHATEAEQDVNHYLPHVRSLVESGELVRLLDFGCGAGEFLDRFLSGAGFRPNRLTIALVEPDDVYRQQAVTRTQAFTTASVAAWPSLPTEVQDYFHLALSNHVLYYVVDLDETLRQILNALTVGGLFLMAIAGSQNVLMQFIERCFALLHQPLPYYRAEEVDASLARLGIAFQKYNVPYQIDFSDTQENRLKILRFLLGNHFAEMDQREALKLFDAYSNDGRIVIHTFHNHYVIRRK